LTDAFERTRKILTQCVATCIHGAFVDVYTLSVDRFVAVFAVEFFANVRANCIYTFLIEVTRRS
jgi:hypothetical protein